MDLARLVAVAHTDEYFEMEIHFPRTHAAHVEGEHRAHEINGRVDVVEGHNRHGARDFECVECVASAGTRESLGEGRAVEVVLTGREVDRHPAIGEFGRESDVLWPFGS